MKPYIGRIECVRRDQCSLVGLSISELTFTRELKMVVEGAAVASDSCLRRSIIGLG